MSAVFTLFGHFFIFSATNLVCLVAESEHWKVLREGGGETAVLHEEEGDETAGEDQHGGRGTKEENREADCCYNIVSGSLTSLRGSLI